MMCYAVAEDVSIAPTQVVITTNDNTLHQSFQPSFPFVISHHGALGAPTRHQNFASCPALLRHWG